MMSLCQEITRLTERGSVIAVSCPSGSGKCRCTMSKRCSRCSRRAISGIEGATATLATMPWLAGAHRQVAVVAVLVGARDVVRDEIDRNDVLGQSAEQRAQVALDAADVAVELAEVEDLHAERAPTNGADAVT